MQLTSAAFEHGNLIPTRYTCDGQGHILAQAQLMVKYKRK